MVHTVLATFKFKSVELKQEFLEIAHSENGIAKTRKWKGCVAIECYDMADDETGVVIWQKWDNKDDHAAYFEMRKEEGLLDKIKETFSEPLTMTHLTNINV